MWNMNNSKHSKKNKCSHCHTYVSILGSVKYLDCCQSILCLRCFSFHKCSKSIEQQQINLCQRCLKTQASLVCKNCNDRHYCRQCDGIVHEGGKFCLHQRSYLDFHMNGENEKMKVSISELKEVMNIRKIQKSLEEQAINQKWDELIKSIADHFEAALNKLKDKKSEVMQKVKMRKEQELRKYLSKQNIKTTTNNFSQKSSESKSFIRGSLEENSSYQNMVNLKLNDKIFEELQQALQKICLKNLVYKIVSIPEIPKKSMRSSLVLPSNSINMRKSVRSPQNANCKLSRSTMEGQIIEKINEEDLFIRKDKIKEPLIKVKSEKVFGSLMKGTKVNKLTGSKNGRRESKI